MQNFELKYIGQFDFPVLLDNTGDQSEAGLLLELEDTSARSKADDIYLL